ncbi:metallophosphoesterase [Alteribacter natronophilus]|uniref:metallophosphoesterase n=1 Tax=Alteribacter natronophilus TaxID=2583810 RepID=UPI00110F3DA1|nr:metallophosphoesterase [Alteribacter natronophilus]TMW73627.1 metallophosphoesterase [Alteribacter natronophilus]
MIYFLIAAAVTAGLAAVHMVYLARNYRVTHETAGLPIKMRTRKVLFISDIHRRSVKSLVRDLEQGHTDMVWIAGDLAEKGVPRQRIETNIRLLKRLAPVIFVWGNNDYEWPSDALEKLLKENGVQILKDDCLIFEEEYGTWCLAGTDDLTSGQPDFPLLNSKLTGYAVLLAHNPETVNSFAPGTFRYALTGHTHGGQIRLGPFGIAERGGWKYRNGTRLLISEGFGTTRLPFRLGTRSECHMIRICTDEQTISKG